MKIYTRGVVFLVCMHYTLVLSYFNETALRHYVLPVVLTAVSWTLLRLLAARRPSRPGRVEFGSSTLHCPICLCNRAVASAHHCATCNTCVIGFDHHCDVIDVCIATRNLHRFRVFVVYHTCVAAYVVNLHITYARRMTAGVPRSVMIIIAMELNIAITLTLFATFHLCLWLLGLRTIDVCRWFVRCMRTVRLFVQRK